MINIFDFGANWEEFSKRRVDQQRLDVACESLRSLLENESLADKSFLDVGCGSGLFSIAAHRLGATRVVGLDLNLRCIEAAQSNRNLSCCIGVGTGTTPAFWQFRFGLCVGVVAPHGIDVECDRQRFPMCWTGRNLDFSDLQQTCDFTGLERH